ncbi:MAG: M48 family metallopeptidase [Muribaculaceae bacterium]|nr:M48 family metallopeptidase [Muribaculaceae bacterium]
MRKILLSICLIAASVAGVQPASAQFLKKVNVSKLKDAAKSTAAALTLSDAQMAEYVKESVAEMDRLNHVPGEDSPYTQRLNRLTEGLTDVDGIPLNFKVYEVVDVNAFACPDGSVRVFAGLMDIMNDDELLGIIGHEVGHVAKRHSKESFKQALYSDALKNSIAAANEKAGKLSESTLSQLGEKLVNAKYSQKHEYEADEYGYEFLKSHGRNPWGMVDSFEKLLEMESGQNANTSNYFQKMFASHPETEKRIERLTKRAEKDGIERPAK